MYLRCSCTVHNVRVAHSCTAAINKVIHQVQCTKKGISMVCMENSQTFTVAMHLVTVYMYIRSGFYNNRVAAMSELEALLIN